MELSRGVFGRVTIGPLLWRKAERPTLKSHGYTIIFHDRKSRLENQVCARRPRRARAVPNTRSQKPVLTPKLLES